MLKERLGILKEIDSLTLNVCGECDEKKYSGVNYRNHEAKCLRECEVGESFIQLGQKLIENTLKKKERPKKDTHTRSIRKVFN